MYWDDVTLEIASRPPPGGDPEILGARSARDPEGRKVSIDPSLILMRLSALLLRRSRLPVLLLSWRSSDSCSDCSSLAVGSPSLPLLPAA
jgi:hypothetical protein